MWVPRRLISGRINLLTHKSKFTSLTSARIPRKISPRPLHWACVVTHWRATGQRDVLLYSRKFYMQKAKKAVCICSVVLAAAFSLPVAAQTHASPMTPDEISARHDADMKRCDAMKGNDRDVCKKEADAKRDSAKADAKAGKETAEA